MSYGIDLSPRQTTRILQQAVRRRAEVILLPRAWPEDEQIGCCLESIEAPRETGSSRAYLVIAPSPGLTDEQAATDKQAHHATAGDYRDLVGTYCDVALRLGENQFVFCTDVIAVSGVGGASRICLARPEVIQVCQRRRFYRFRPARSAHVSLYWSDNTGLPGLATGWMLNVSADGLACRVDLQIADRLAIGEPLRVEFCLEPGDPGRFILDATVCSKSPGGTEGTMILGLHFLVGEGHESSTESANNLRGQLVQRYAPRVNVSKGADV
jgi:hypothetical protein